MGAMGEVYHARDTRLNRMVALKILSGQLRTLPEHHDRFMQEAQLASSLQHPNIVSIFDIGTDGALTYLAMELVRGRPLDQVISPDGLRIKDALRYAIEIADGLSAAHGSGIVHRDLKPANIMIAENGHVKILDFGLATLVPPAHASGTDETTLQQRIVETSVGTILGTVAYMSPEQVEGKPVDGRSDLFSFGAILYEMVSGRRPFRADSTAGTLASILNSEPLPLTESVGGMPRSLDKVVSRCLRKDPTRRAQHASDVKLALEEVLEELASTSSAVPAVRPAKRRAALVAVWVAAVAVVASAAAVVWWPRRIAPEIAFEARPLTTLPGFEEAPTFSPDATQVAFCWYATLEGKPDIYVQVIGAPGPPLRLTTDDAAHVVPSWSPDGKSVALWHTKNATGATGATLVLVSPLGGPERQLMDWSGPLERISWSPDSRWIAVANSFGTADRGIVLISPATGGRVEWRGLNPILTAATEPMFSPDGKRLAFIKTAGDLTGEAYVVDVGDDGRPASEPVRLHLNESEVHSPVWTGDGKELLLVAGNTSSNGGVIRVPVDGSLPPRRIPTLSYTSTLALSRDGTKLAFSRGGPNAEILRLDLQHPERSAVIASSSMFENSATYSPDGRRIAFASNRSGSREIWVSDESGENAQPLTRFGGPVAGVPQWSPDGQQLVFDARPEGHPDVFVVPAAGGSVRRITTEPGEDARPVWSPDGRWIYFSSDRSGRSEIWRSTPTGEHPVQVTRTGASTVAASPDNEWLYYRQVAPPHFLRRIRPDGSGDEEFVRERVPMLSFSATRSGVWFVTKPEQRERFSLRVLRAGERVPKDIFTLGPLFSGYTVSVSPDERFALITTYNDQGADLQIIENFR